MWDDVLRRTFTFVVLAVFAFAGAACESSHAERDVDDSIEEAADDVGDTAEEAAEETEEAVEDVTD